MPQAQPLKDQAKHYRDNARLGHSASVLLGITAAVLMIPRAPHVGTRAAHNLIRFSKSAITADQTAAAAATVAGAMGFQRFRAWQLNQSCELSSSANTLENTMEHASQP